MSKEILTETFKKYILDTLDQPTATEVSRMIEYCQKGFFEQVIYNFPENFITIILKYYEDMEEYEMCAKILEKIVVHNLINGTDVPCNIHQL